MGLRLVPKSVTLNDLKRRNDSDRYFAEFGSFWAVLHKMVEDTRIHSVSEM